MMRILIVEDEPSIAMALEDDLRREGYQVDLAMDGEEACRLGTARPFDLILLDVPCSNTGVLARRVEAKYRFSARSLRSLVDLQRQIIADSLRLASSRGWLMYTTCSIEPLENQHQAAWLTQWHPYEAASQESRMPVGTPGEDPASYRDGGYWALFRRR